MKIGRIGLMAAAVLLPTWALAQGTNAPAGPAAPEAAAALNKFAFILPVVIPMLIALLKAEVPKLPGWSLPLLAPALGAAGDWLLGLNLGPGLAAALGMAGVGVRELQDQVRQRVASAGGPTAGTGTAAVKTLLLLGVAAGLVCGCSSFVTNAQKSLYSGSILSDGTMKGYAVWWKDQTNRLGDTPALELQRSNVMALSVKVGKSIEVAQGTLDSYAANVGTNTATSDVITALVTAAVQNAGNFAAEIAVLTGKTVTP